MVQYLALLLYWKRCQGSLPWDFWCLNDIKCPLCSSEKTERVSVCVSVGLCVSFMVNRPELFFSVSEFAGLCINTRHLAKDRQRWIVHKIK